MPCCVPCTGFKAQAGGEEKVLHSNDDKGRFDVVDGYGCSVGGERSVLNTQEMVSSAWVRLLLVEGLNS